MFLLLAATFCRYSESPGNHGVDDLTTENIGWPAVTTAGWSGVEEKDRVDSKFVIPLTTLGILGGLPSNVPAATVGARTTMECHYL